MTQENSLCSQFLIAMPAVVQGEFDHSVTFLCEHNESGAMGLVINRPTTLRLADMFQHMGLETSNFPKPDYPVYWGGPVQTERGFVLHSPNSDWDSTLKVNQDIALTTSKDILEAISEGKGPANYLVTLGYAGWSEGQLEDEILKNSWLTTPSDKDILFATPAPARWTAAAQLLGVDPSLLSGEAGHA
ncbi:MAG: YqgE/AlgH family protein [Nevskiales bacterium]